MDQFEHLELMLKILVEYYSASLKTNVSLENVRVVASDADSEFD